MTDSPIFIRPRLRVLFSRQFWQAIRDYLGAGRHKKAQRIETTDNLSHFLSSRASHVAQTSLYGYLRTRAGTRFPELFERPDMLVSINIAKWHIWLACLSDLCVYFGQLIHESGDYTPEQIHKLMVITLGKVLEETGNPDEAGPDFNLAKEKAVQRIHTCDWSVEKDDDTIFSQSPDALVYWAPIAHELKQRDEEIVQNSIRFRWIEVRRSARKQLDIDSLMEQPSE